MKISLSLFVLLSFSCLKAQVAVITANDSTLCFGEQILLSSALSDAGNSPITNTIWKFEGNGLLIEDTLSFGTNFTLNNINPGTYDVSIVNIHQDLTQSSTSLNQFIQIYPNPIADFSFSQFQFGQAVTGANIICPPVQVNFTDQSSSDYPITHYQWSLNTILPSLPLLGPVTSTVQNPSNINYCFPGNYIVGLIVEDINSCRDTMSIIDFLVIGGPSTELDLIQEATICAQDFDLFLSNADNVASYSWQISDGSTYSGNFINDTILHHHLQDVGTFVSNFTVVDATACTVSYTDTFIVVSGGINVDFTPSQLYTSTSDSLLFTDNSTNISGQIDYRIWDFGDGTIDTLTNETEINHIYQNAGNHLTSLKIVNSQGCSDRAFENIHVLSTVVNNSYPNPASQHLNFYHIDYLNIAYLYVLDFNGTEILTIPFINNPQTIDISSLSDGMYFLKYWLNNVWVYEQFMVQN